MQKMGLGVEACIWIATLMQVVVAHRLRLASVSPPFAGCLSRRWDHGVQQHQLRYRQSIAGQRRAESAHRLSDEGHFVACPRGDDDGIGMIGEGGARPVGQGHCDTVVAGPFKERLDQPPVASVAARAGNQDEAVLPHVCHSLLIVQRPITRLLAQGRPSTVSACP
jgi:hypothetical protein